jgi:predicted nucleotidyltransferase
MAYTKDQAVAIARDFLREAVGRHRILKAYLFGSTVWGRSQDHSDIDLAVVLEDRSSTVHEPFGEAFAVFHAAQEYNSALEVICLSEAEFSDDTRSLVRRIRTEGLELPVPVAA